MFSALRCRVIFFRNIFADKLQASKVI